MNDTVPELLAPAGNMAAALAAFDAGADAVYAGLRQFNARERSENFSSDEMGRLIAYAHKHRKKVYVTFNTLVKETELAEAAALLAELNAVGPDALIIQDLGILRLAREYFPALPLHASTQMGFHNSAGLELAAAMGFRRVILERQITLDELRTLAENTPVELEMFIHGALCCSLAGKCLFSSWHGGHSGNRGRCKQPCRRRFFGRDGNGFFFSTNDLFTADLMGPIKASGVRSLKIEGRLRQPDYVYNVVAAYRQLLDAPGEPDRKLLGEARNRIARSFGRKWSHGYYDGEKSGAMVDYASLGTAGLLCGKVTGIRPGGFDVKVGKPLYLGDRIRVQPPSGEEGPALTVTRLYCRDRGVSKLAPGATGFICCDKPVDSRGLVFKTGSSHDSYTARAAALPSPRRRIDLDIAVSAVAITVQAGALSWRRDINPAPAAKHPLEPEMVRNAFAAGSPEAWTAGNVVVAIDGNYFLPAGELKQLRRDFWAFAAGHLPALPDPKEKTAAMIRFQRDYAAMVPASPVPEDAPPTIAVRPHGPHPTARREIQAMAIFHLDRHAVEAVLPEFCPEPRLAVLQKLIAQAVKDGIRRFRITAPYALPLLRSYEGLTLTASLSLPVCNSLAAAELAVYGVDRVQGHVELERPALEALRDHSPLPVEIYRYGRPVLLVTRAKIAVEGEIHDSRGMKFHVNYDPEAGLTYVRPGPVVDLPHVPGTYDFYDWSAADRHEKTVAVFNFDTAMI
ncbi:MAG: U32 family peptidase [Victivallales bacterium]|nr:U32 family peptidase [Victivallales bacterium]